LVKNETIKYFISILLGFSRWGATQNTHEAFGRLGLMMVSYIVVPGYQKSLVDSA
jgi:hypothetical protein